MLCNYFGNNAYHSQNWTKFKQITKIYEVGTYRLKKDYKWTMFIRLRIELNIVYEDIKYNFV